MKMDIPKTGNNYKSPENQVPTILNSGEKDSEAFQFQKSEEDTYIEHEKNGLNAFLSSYLKNSDTLLISTNEWLGTWRPLKKFES